MIEGFEKYTYELTDQEKEILPGMVEGLKRKIGSNNAITNKSICDAYKKIGKKIDPPRVRKLIHYIRINGLVPRLVASSKGYYVANNKEDLNRYITSLEQREAAIKSIRKNAQIQFNKWF